MTSGRNRYKQLFCAVVTVVLPDPAIQLASNRSMSHHFADMSQNLSKLRLDAMILGFGQGIGHEPKEVIHQDAGLGKSHGVGVTEGASHGGFHKWGYPTMDGL